MTQVDVPLVLFAIGGIVAYLFAAWTARSLAGAGWLPYLAFLHVVGLRLVFGGLTNAGVTTLERSAESPEMWIRVSSTAWSVITFAEHAILALMLYLIARRLPRASREAEDGAPPA